MKRIILSLMAICTLLGAQAQQYVRLNTTAGWREIPYSQFAGLKFITEGTPDPAGNEAVDLGLSVKWASMDYHEKEPYTNLTTNAFTFSPYTDYQLDEAGNLAPSYDRVHENWGGAWRMPTLAEWQELVEKCSWDRGYDSALRQDVWIVTGKNGNSIHLPRYSSTSSSVCTYWTANTYPQPSCAMAVNPEYGWFGYIQVVLQDPRVTSMIRPVSDENATGFAETAFPGRTFETEDGLVYMALTDSTAAVIDGRKCKGNLVMPDQVAYQGKKLRVVQVGAYSSVNRYREPIYSEEGELAGYKELPVLQGLFEGAAITSVRLANGLRSIPGDAFADCNQLREVTLPAELQSMSFSGLSIIPNLVKITCTGTVPPTVWPARPLFRVDEETGEVLDWTNQFGNFIRDFRQRGGVLACPDALRQTYQQALPWGCFLADPTTDTGYEMHLVDAWGEVVKKILVKNGTFLGHMEIGNDYGYGAYNAITGELYYHSLQQPNLRYIYRLELHKDGKPVTNEEFHVHGGGLMSFPDFALLPEFQTYAMGEDFGTRFNPLPIIVNDDFLSTGNQSVALANNGQMNIYNWMMNNGRVESSDQMLQSWFARSYPGQVTHLVPNDEAWAAGVPYTLSFPSLKPQSWSLTYNEKGNLPLRANIYQYDVELGEVRPNPYRGETWDRGSLVSLLNTLMREHTILGDINSGNEYFKTLGGTVVRYKDGKFQSPLDMDYEAQGAAPTLGTQASVVEHKEAPGRSWYLTDHVLAQPCKGAYEVLGTLPECSDFFELCCTLEQEIIEAMEQDETYQAMNNVKKRQFLKSCLFFSSTINSSSALGLYPIKNKDYTLFVPNNAAMAKERAAGRLDTWQQKVDFVRYHLCFGSEYADKLPFEPRRHATTCLQERNGYATQYLTVSSQGNGELSVTDGTGAKHKVVKSNIFTYEQRLNKSSVQASTLLGITIDAVTPGVIHVIDSALHNQ